MSDTKIATTGNGVGARLVRAIVDNSVKSLYDEQADTGSYVMNFSPRSNGNEQVLFAAEESATREPMQHVSEPFPARFWVAKKIILPDMETGEMRPAVRLVLISPECETLAFVSIGAAVSWDLIRAVRGDGPYDPALPVLVKPEKTRGGFTTFRLRLANPA